MYYFLLNVLVVVLLFFFVFKLLTYTSRNPDNTNFKCTFYKKRKLFQCLASYNFIKQTGIINCFILNLSKIKTLPNSPVYYFLIKNITSYSTFSSKDMNFKKNSFNLSKSTAYSYNLFKNFLVKVYDSNTFYFSDRFKNYTNFKIVANVFFYDTSLKIWPSRYNVTDLLKLERSFNKNKILFLRKNKIFNKSRYSRNRQLYRTGVYWCLWVSIFLGWGLYFSFYRITINFSYLWWLNYFILSSFLFSKFVKYNLYNITFLFDFVIKILTFSYFCFLSFYEAIKTAYFNFSLLLSGFSLRNNYILFWRLI